MGDTAEVYVLLKFTDVCSWIVGIFRDMETATCAAAALAAEFNMRRIEEDAMIECEDAHGEYTCVAQWHGKTSSLVIDKWSITP